jgi:hypothetical protein
MRTVLNLSLFFTVLCPTCCSLCLPMIRENAVKKVEERYNTILLCTEVVFVCYLAPILKNTSFFKSCNHFL